MILHLALLLLSAAAFLALCAGLKRYQRGLFGRQLDARQSRTLRIGGWALLATAFLFGWIGSDFGRAMILLAGYSTIGALLSVFLVTRGEARRKEGDKPRGSRESR